MILSWYGNTYIISIIWGRHISLNSSQCDKGVGDSWGITAPKIWLLNNGSQVAFIMCQLARYTIRKCCLSYSPRPRPSLVLRLFLWHGTRLILPSKLITQAQSRSDRHICIIHNIWRFNLPFYFKAARKTPGVQQLHAAPCLLFYPCDRVTSSNP